MSNETGIDEDLQGLFDELDKADEGVADIILSPEVPVKTAGTVIDKLDELEDIEVVQDHVMRPTDIRKGVKHEIVAETKQTSSLDLDTKKYKEQLDVVTTEVLQACRADRQEAQDVINDLKNRMAAVGGAPPKALVDGLVKAVEVKANINGNAIRMMDTNAKFLAALKTINNITNNLNLSASSEELRKILE